MKTVFEAKQHLFDYLKNKTSISGSVYKDRRPTGSKKEDIVINSLTMTNDFLQNVVLNVNCYVPYLEVAEKVTQYYPDNKRMGVLAKELIKLLTDVSDDAYNATIVYHTTFDDDVTKSNYINFRVQMYLFNNYGTD